MPSNVLATAAAQRAAAAAIPALARTAAAKRDPGHSRRGRACPGTTTCNADPERPGPERKSGPRFKCIALCTVHNDDVRTIVLAVRGLPDAPRHGTRNGVRHRSPNYDDVAGYGSLSRSIARAIPRPWLGNLLDGLCFRSSCAGFRAR